MCADCLSSGHERNLHALVVGLRHEPSALAILLGYHHCNNAPVTSNTHLVRAVNNGTHQTSEAASRTSHNLHTHRRDLRLGDLVIKRREVFLEQAIELGQRGIHPAGKLGVELL